MWRCATYRMPPTTILLLDDGMPEPSLAGRAPHGAALIFARRLSSLHGRVERVLLLHDGRLVALDPPVGAPLIARRVAESFGSDSRAHADSS